MKKNIFALSLAALLCAGCTAETVPSQSGSGGTQMSVTEVSQNNVFSVSPENAASDSTPVLKKGQIAFGQKSGFYDKNISLEIFCGGEDGVIYYTTDGSEPTKRSTQYTEPIALKNKSGSPNVLSAEKGISAGEDYVPKKNVDKANVIRAAAFYPDGTKSEIISGTYFVGIDREKKYGSLPVISIMTDKSNLFDYKKGIYVLGENYDKWSAEQQGKHFEPWESVGNFSMSGQDWERPVSVEYIPFGDGKGFSQDMGIKIMGGASRNSPQKSLKLTARKEYGAKSVKYDLIPGNTRADKKGKLEKYKSFILRNGGNDCDSAKIRDPLFQELSFGRRFETQQFTPCIAFIDGEFWGIYSLTEDYSDNYIENNYGIDKNNVVIVKCNEIEDGKEEDMELYNKLYRFITGNDMSVDKNYAAACEMLDMESFADYCAFNLYIANEDGIFQNNNWRMWRVREPDKSSPRADGKWRMMVYDTDYSAGVYQGGSSGDNDNISEAVDPGRIKNDIESYSPAALFGSLYKNRKFKEELVVAMCDLRNFHFESGRALKRTDELANIYGKVAMATFRRFGPEWLTYQDDGYYDYKISELSRFIDDRYEAFPYVMREAMALSEPKNGEFSVSGGGDITVNVSKIDFGNKSSIKAVYFSGCKLNVSAAPKGDKKFVRWEYEGCTVSDKNSPDITVTITGNFKLSAVFE